MSTAEVMKVVIRKLTDRCGTLQKLMLTIKELRQHQAGKVVVIIIIIFIIIIVIIVIIIIIIIIIIIMERSHRMNSNICCLNLEFH